MLRLVLFDFDGTLTTGDIPKDYAMLALASHPFHQDQRVCAGRNR